MTLSDFIERVNDAVRGIDDDAPLVGTDEWNYWVRLLNRKKNELYEDVSKQWSDTYSVVSLGAVSASATPSYNLSATFLAPANNVYVIDADGNRHDFELIEPQAKSFDKRQFFVAGQNPQKLYCTDEIDADESIVGGTLYLPGYYMPADIDNEDEDAVITLPDPYWGVLAVAAEIAGNDITYEDKEANLVTKTNALYSQMTKKNRRGTYNNPRTSTYNTQRISGF